MTLPDPRELKTTHAGQASDAVEAPAPTPGSRFGGYLLIEMIGQGGMGIVYKARQEAVDRLVALKIMRNRHSGPGEVMRFTNEARAIARLVHPQIVRIHDVGQVDQWHYLACELIRGTALDQIIAEQPMDPQRALEIVAMLAEALDYAHQKGVIHRDLKPSNVLIDAKGDPHLTDFGLARRLDVESGRLTQSGDLLGTPAYMSPEQVSDEFGPIAATTDVHGLGTILYELLTGRPPFGGENMLKTLHQVLYKLPPAPHELSPEVPPSYGELCLKCLAKNPGQRHPTARAVAIHCRGLLAGLVPSPPPAPTLPPAEPSEVRASEASPSTPPAPVPAGPSALRPLLILGCFLAGGLVVHLTRARDKAQPPADQTSRQRPAPSQPDLIPHYIRAIERDDQAAAFEVLARHLIQHPLDWKMRSRRIDLARQLGRVLEVIPDLQALDAADQLSDMESEMLLALYLKLEQSRQASQLLQRISRRQPKLAAELALEQARKCLADDRPLAAARSWLQCPSGTDSDSLFLGTLERKLRERLASPARPADLIPLLLKLAQRDPRFFHWESLSGWLAADLRRLEPLTTQMLETLLAASCRDRKWDGIGRAAGKALMARDLPRANRLARQAADQAKRAFELGRYGEMLRHATRRLFLTPESKSAPARVRRGAAYSELGQRERAIADFTQALKIDPRSSKAYFYRAHARDANGDHDGAIEDYTQVIRITPKDDSAYNNRGVARKRKGDLAGAIQDYEKAIALDPRRVSSYINRSIARAASGDLDGAIRDYDKVIEINPESASDHFYRGNLRQLNGDLDGAIKDYTLTVKINPSEWSIAYVHRALILSHLARNTMAIEDLKKYEELQPKSVLPALWRAALGHPAGTNKLKHLAKNKDSVSDVVRLQLGQMAAADLLRKATQASTPTRRQEALCQAYCHLGLLAERQGNPAKARDYYLKCVATKDLWDVGYGWATMRLSKLTK